MTTRPKYKVELSNDEGLVLYDFLARFNKASQPPVVEDQAEQRVLWDLESSLEELLVEPLDANYDKLLAAARERVRDPQE